MSNDPTRNALAKLVASLGRSAKAVAESLRRQGVRGLRDFGKHCPLANLLRRTWPDLLPFVDVGEISLERNCGCYHETVASIPTPPHVTRFIETFDKGGYADLIELEKPGGEA